MIKKDMEKHYRLGLFSKEPVVLCRLVGGGGGGDGENQCLGVGKTKQYVETVYNTSIIKTHVAR